MSTTITFWKEKISLINKEYLLFQKSPVRPSLDLSYRRHLVHPENQQQWGFLQPHPPQHPLLQEDMQSAKKGEMLKREHQYISAFLV